MKKTHKMTKKWAFKRKEYRVQKIVQGELLLFYYTSLLGKTICNLSNPESEIMGFIFTYGLEKKIFFGRILNYVCLYGYDHFESSPYKETQYHFPFTIFISFLAIL